MIGKQAGDVPILADPEQAYIEDAGALGRAVQRRGIAQRSTLEIRIFGMGSTAPGSAPPDCQAAMVARSLRCGSLRGTPRSSTQSRCSRLRRKVSHIAASSRSTPAGERPPGMARVACPRLCTADSSVARIASATAWGS